MPLGVKIFDLEGFDIQTSKLKVLTSWGPSLHDDMISFGVIDVSTSIRQYFIQSLR